MRRSALLLAAGVLLLAAAPQSRRLAPETVLASYERAIAKARVAPYVTVDYTVEQTGVRAIQQTHRIYRDATNERDELLALNGENLTRPEVRFWPGRRDMYAIRRLAPRAASYAFRLTASHRDGKRVLYDFATVPRVVGSFRIDGMTIDGATFMPTELRFTTKRGAVVGRGSMTFAKMDVYYVPIVASVTAEVDGKPTIERIAWSRYRFPKSLPDNVFMRPRPQPSAEPVL